MNFSRCRFDEVSPILYKNKKWNVYGNIVEHILGTVQYSNGIDSFIFKQTSSNGLGSATMQEITDFLKEKNELL